MNALLRSLAAALGLLTLLPLPVPRLQPIDHARASMWFPLVGLLLGGALAAIAQLALWELSTALTAILLVAASALLTGGLHLDGVADTFDAAGGGRGDRERILSIMRDSRIGAHGACALTLLLGAKAAATAETLRHQALWPVVLAPALARFAVVPLIAWLPYARSEGLGSLFQGHDQKLSFTVAAGTSGAMLWFVWPQAWPALAALTLTTMLLSGWAMRRVGGLTGDLYGATIELAEVAFLVAAS